MKRPWMPFYLDDFTLDTLDLSADEIGVYITMICLAWRRGDGSITGDMDELKRVLKRCFADFHGHTFNRIVPKLLERYFELRDGRWFQKRVVFELERAEKLSARQSEIAGKRWAKSGQTRGIRAANAPQTVGKIRANAEQTKVKSESGSNENNDLVDAVAIPACARQPHTQSQIQEEERKKENARERASSAFEKFWHDYPNKIGKRAAQKSFETALKSVELDALMAGLQRYAAKTDDRPWCNPATWLNQQRWLDQPALPIARAPPARVNGQSSYKDQKQQDWDNARQALRESIERDELEESSREADGLFPALPRH